MKIGYAGSFDFPEGGPGTVHVIGVAKALRDLGNEVVFFSNKKNAQNPTSVAITEYRDGVPTYNGFKYRSLEHKETGIGGRFRRQVSITTGASVFKRFEAEERSTGPFDAIIIYQPQSLLFYRVLNWCRKRNIPLICDVVEWHDLSNMGGLCSYSGLNSELNMRKLYFLSDGVLTISKYLEAHYSNRGLPTLRMPNLIDGFHNGWTEAGNPIEKVRSKKLRLCFVGTAAYKDLLVNAVRGLSLIGAKECEIVIIGPSREEMKLSLGADGNLIEMLQESLRFTGRLPHAEALEKLAQSDYSILLRPNARFTNAGFPTKLVESLALGVPVICNLTGDVGLYVRDGYEGIVVPDASPESFAGGIHRALSISPDEALAMRRHARKRAEESFDYRNWVSPLGEFIERVTASVNQKKFLP